MPPAAFALALGAAFLHALWNLLLAKERDPEPATAIAICASVFVFAPVAAVFWDVDSQVWPYLVATSALQLAYFALLASAYRYAELSFVYPVARGLAPVLVLLVGAAFLGVGASASQAVGVCAVGLGVLLVRGIGRERDLVGGVLALTIATTIAGYTLVDREGVQHAAAIPYLELALLPVAILAAAVVGPRRLREQFGATAVAGAIAGFGAYTLVLLALRLAEAPPVAAVRETSVVIAVVLAAPLLGERVTRVRLAGAALVVGGVILLSS